MDYQTSTSSSKAIVFFSVYKKIAVVLGIMASSLLYTHAQFTENPLFVDITITAGVLSTTYNTPQSQTQPIPPALIPTGALGTTFTTDAAIFRGMAYQGSIIHSPKMVKYLQLSQLILTVLLNYIYGIFQQERIVLVLEHRILKVSYQNSFFLQFTLHQALQLSLMEFSYHQHLLLIRLKLSKVSLLFFQERQLLTRK